MTQNTDQENSYKVSISKQELSTLQAASFNGDIILVDSEEEATKAADVLRKEKVIGFDTETKPSFKRGQSNTVALLQLSTHSTCFLFRLNHIGLNKEIREILESPDILKIGVSIHDDFHHLQKVYDLHPDGFIDLQAFVKDYDIIDNSLSRIYAILFNQRISKGQRLTNWEAPALTKHQQEYASLDAYACIQIFDELTQKGFNPEESKYYRLITPPTPVNAESVEQEHH